MSDDIDDLARRLNARSPYMATVSDAELLIIAADALLRLRDERDALRKAIMGDDPAPGLSNGCFVEMASDLELARQGALARATAAEAQLKTVLEREAATTARYDAKLDATEARAERLAEAAQHALDTLIELNPSNYNHDDVCQANNATVEVMLSIRAALAKENQP